MAAAMSCTVYKYCVSIIFVGVREIVGWIRLYKIKNTGVQPNFATSFSLVV